MGKAKVWAEHGTFLQHPSEFYYECPRKPHKSAEGFNRSHESGKREYNFDEFCDPSHILLDERFWIRLR